MNTILQLLTDLLNWWIDTGLARDTADACGYIVTYTVNVLVPLMWEYINTIFGAGVVL